MSFLAAPAAGFLDALASRFSAALAADAVAPAAVTSGRQATHNQEKAKSVKRSHASFPLLSRFYKDTKPYSRTRVTLVKRKFSRVTRES